MRPALLVIDVQRDFCPGGALAVRAGDEIIPRLNGVVSAFERLGFPIFYTRDWHPPNHISFNNQGGIWPPHCVQGTAGAEFHPNLIITHGAVIVSKGEDAMTEAYSGFQGTDLGPQMKKTGVEEIFIGGLATDYCVKESVLDACKRGFKVTVIEDCIRAVEASLGDGARALGEMERAGARIATASTVVMMMASTQQ